MIFDENDDVSVVIPFYKCPQYKNRIVNSIFKQTLLPHQVVIIDDGLGVGLAELKEEIKKYNISVNIKYLSTLGNTGPASARNLGINQCTGRYVLFLDCDDEWHSDYVKNIVNFSRENKAGLCTCNVEWRKNGVLLSISIYPKLIYTKQLYQTNPIQTPAVLVDRKIINNFSFPIVKHEDLALWISLTSQYNIPFKVLDQVLVTINRESNSVSSRKYASIVWHWQLINSISQIRFGYKIIYFMIYVLNAILKRVQKQYRPLFIS